MAACETGAMAVSRALASSLLTCNRLPKATACRTPGMPPQFVCEVVQVWPADRPGRETCLGNDLWDRPMCKQSPVGDIRQAVTSFCFVHVVGRNQKRQPLGGQLDGSAPRIPGALSDPLRQSAHRAAEAWG